MKIIAYGFAIVAGMAIFALLKTKKVNAYRFALLTAVATFILLLIGGLVNPTGSSLACPDWPLCHGTAFPNMVNGVQFEHSHRIVAGVVALMTVVLGVVLLLEKRVKLGAIAVGMVILQAVLGGLTVLLKLPPEISIGHLALSMAFFSFVIYVAVRTKPATDKPAILVPSSVRSWLLIATGGVYLQIVLGAVVRHLHAALACANDVPLCFGQVWPTFSPLAQIHMAHRIFGVVVGLVAIVATARASFHLPKGSTPRKLALLVPSLVVAQLTLGVLTVLSLKGLAQVEAHLGVGALLLGTLWLLTLNLGAQRAERREVAQARETIEASA